MVVRVQGADMVARGPANVTCLKLAAERNHGPAVAFLESVVGGKSAQKHAPYTGMVGRIDSVSYTHLTLPTICSV